MKITAPHDTTVAGRGTRDRIVRTTRRGRLLALTGAGLVIALLTYFSTVSYFPEGITAALWNMAKDYGYTIFPPRERLRSAIRHIPGHLLARTDTPRLLLDISFLNMQKLRARRDEALERQLLIQQGDDFVPAVIRHGSRSLPARVRLKGDFIDHLWGDKWSFRVHLKGKETLFGMRRFSIQSPVTRDYQAELLFHETLRPFDVLTPAYLFVDVAINGDDIGIMALEEHFARELLERHGRKDGVILKFNDSLMWLERLQPDKNRKLYNDHLKSGIEAFGTGRIEKSATLSRDYATAVGLLRGFIEGRLPASEVFDVERTGSFLAAIQLWGAEHASFWPNLRYYLNPLTLRLEPVSFDATLQSRLPAGTNALHEPLIQDMLRDPLIEAAYRKTLSQLVAGVQDGSLTSRLQDVERKALSALRKEYVLLDGFDFAELARRAAAIPDLWAEPDIELDNYPAYVSAWLIDNADGTYVELVNLLDLDVEISAIEWDTGKGTREPFENTPPTVFPLRLAASEHGRLPTTVRLPYATPGPAGRAHLEVKARISGTDRMLSHRAQPYFAALEAPPLPSVSLQAALEQHPFLDLADDGATLRVQPGSWEVSGALVIPHGHELEIPAGTTLRFGRDGALVAYAATRLAGDPDRPVRLEGVDGAPWMGVVVHQADRRSRWSRVRVSDTTGIDFPAWKLTGGVTFYRSGVDLEHCTFSGNRGEDALNIIHADFTLADSLISDTVSDAFDGDFTTGTVSASEFRNIGTAGGGDGVDVSGSEVTVTNSRFSGISDKAVSVGERSTVHAGRLTMENVGTGAASKDGSSLVLEDSTIRQARHAGLMAYVKKPAYGNASLDATGIEFEQTEREAIAQQGSRLTLNGTAVAGQEMDVGKLYENEMRPGLAK